MKTAYKLCWDTTHQPPVLQLLENWNAIWRLEVPPKVKTFTWRACKNVLPTQLRLQDKGIQCPPLCAICTSAGENSWHLFLTCSRSCQCWENEGFCESIQSYMATTTSFKDVFFKMASKSSQACMVQFVSS